MNAVGLMPPSEARAPRLGFVDDDERQRDKGLMTQETRAKPLGRALRNPY